jgi:hypothetical protein
MLLYIITNAVMFSFLMASEQIPQVTAQWMLDQGLRVVASLLFVNVRAPRQQRDGAFLDRAHHGADPLPVAMKLDRPAFFAPDSSQQAFIPLPVKRVSV